MTSIPFPKGAVKAVTCLMITLCVIIVLSACDVYRGRADIVIENVNVIDAVNGLRRNMTVVIDGPNIVKTSPGEQAAGVASTRRVDGRGKYLIPGLWDAHVHITFTPELEHSMFPLLPGFSLHKELETLVTAGMSPLQALESATLAPAEYFNLHQTQGLIAPAMLADLVLLDANPLEDIRNTRKIDAVIKSGRFIAREELDRLLSDAARGNALDTMNHK